MNFNPVITASEWLCRLRTNWLVGLFLLALAAAHGQRTDTLSTGLKVLARPSLDSIVLRWAPGRANDWIVANNYGYTIERYTLLRDDKLLDLPERKTLTLKPFMPLPLQEWEPLVKSSKYGAIAAQALYGDSFELTNQGNGVFTIVNKVKENEQRFSFAVFAADVSPPVASALALRWVDREVVKNEKYLYRISCIPNNDSDTLKGFIFVAPERYEIPRPIDFSARFQGRFVSLKWDQSYFLGIFSSFVVERATEGEDFKSISEDPLITLSEPGKNEIRYQYATDSLPELGKEYRYRVRGLTPFGEMGPPSDEVRGTGLELVEDVPHIINDESRDNKSIRIDWEFPISSEPGLQGFDIRRVESPKDHYASILDTLISASQRTFLDIKPTQTNYYQVVALTHQGVELKSAIYYAQLVDSIPPQIPQGLKGQAKETGEVLLTWLPNSDPDIYGYRVYRANFLSEEFSQVTKEPTRQTSFLDSVNLKTLNRYIHYQIMAIDKNQNHSALSAALSILLPDKVKPVPPVFMPPVSTQKGTLLQWTPSGSKDVHHYDVYRRHIEADEWLRIATVGAIDTVYRYMDTTGIERKICSYTVLAVDSAGLESDPANPVSASKIVSQVKPSVVVVADVDRTNKQILLKWSYREQGVARFQIYKAREGEPLKLLSTITGSTFSDNHLILNSIYTYRVVALFRSGARSAFSNEIRVRY